MYTLYRYTAIIAVTNLRTVLVFWGPGQAVPPVKNKFCKESLAPAGRY